MRLSPPCSAVEFETQTIYDKQISLNDFQRKAVILSFFRDTARPLQNKRVFEFSRNYKAWRKVGVEVIVVFSNSETEVKKFFAKHPRPFPVIADPELKLYQKYGVEQVVGESKVSRLHKLPQIIYKLFSGNRAKYSPFGRIMPADFLINLDGVVVDVWYGKNELDHIPFDRLEKFVMAMRVAMRKKAAGTTS